jgi:hypothetical protein
MNRAMSGGLSKSGVTHGERVKALIFVRSAFGRQWETEKVGGIARNFAWLLSSPRYRRLHPFPDGWSIYN